MDSIQWTDRIGLDWTEQDWLVWIHWSVKKSRFVPSGSVPEHQPLKPRLGAFVKSLKVWSSFARVHYTSRKHSLVWGLCSLSEPLIDTRDPSMKASCTVLHKRCLLESKSYLFTSAAESIIEEGMEKTRPDTNEAVLCPKRWPADQAYSPISVYVRKGLARCLIQSPITQSLRLPSGFLPRPN